MNPTIEEGTEEGTGLPADPAETGWHGRRRVLVVDDDPDAAGALAELLSMNGHEVGVATDANQALLLFQSLQPQVAVLDIGLPVMDGYELQARMCKLRGGADCMYVALTGYGMKSEQEQSRRAGFRAHLVKPVNLGRLAALIESSGVSAGSSDAPGSAAPEGRTGSPESAGSPRRSR